MFTTWKLKKAIGFFEMLNFHYKNKLQDAYKIYLTILVTSVSSVNCKHSFIQLK